MLLRNLIWSLLCTPFLMKTNAKAGNFVGKDVGTTSGVEMKDLPWCLSYIDYQT